MADQGSTTIQNEEWIDLTGQDKKLLKKILKQGNGDEQPQTGSEVICHYVGRLYVRKVNDAILLV